LILGLDNAGKTTLLKKLCGEDTGKVEPTVGFNIETLSYHNLYNLNFWDVGGQKSIRAYWRNYFEQTDGLIWVVDSADKNRLQICRDELNSLLQEERLAGASVLILANKQDIPNTYSVEEISQILKLNDDNERMKTRHWKIVPCSAIVGNGVVDGLDWIVTDISSRIFLLG
jgi:ADP-ribosylation factor-like protein 2